MKLIKGYYSVIMIHRHNNEEIELHKTIGYYDEEFDVRPWSIIGDTEVYETYNKESNVQGLFVKPLNKVNINEKRS